ncbi:hypothetical protein CH64_474 [Yersinia rohdei]|uniref:Uncharacterized protein n=1 Tax=Yersinia rohdei TaxID=29485 RepID=A0ABN4F4G3_YERRO|nr:hypothetical protein CH64_474 [Yersinia rohdei]EEQ02085.1 hypothetical protein yrohd0001_32020 [Yersinia rohdei ATCC 43380]CNE00103.1 Uncharacterised protein [Yersinia rohdei]CNI27418.1 Uncharacterised protein [Yersinia rohdei]CQJ57400.1 Uncharacterised protein [Yersinia rohdei]
MQNDVCKWVTLLVLQIFLLRVIGCVVWGIGYNDPLFMDVFISNFAE